MTIDNMNSALRGWAKLDTAAGETAIQSNVNWGIVDYTDATARQYLIDFANIPTANILVKVNSVPKHSVHISHLTNIPTANILVKVAV
jgi:hypothetical protein